MFKSQPLTIDTSEAIEADHSSTAATTSTTSSTTTSAFPTARTEIATTMSPTPTTPTTLVMWRTSETPSTADDEINNQVVYKPHKDPFALLRKHQQRKTVHHNEILPHQQRRIATAAPSTAQSHDAGRRPGRLSLGLLLAVILAGTAMLGVWLLLLRRYDAVADGATKRQRAQKTTTGTEERADRANIGRDPLGLWIGAADEADEADALPTGGSVIVTSDGGPVDVPLMRVIHV